MRRIRDLANVELAAELLPSLGQWPIVRNCRPVSIDDFAAARRSRPHRSRNSRRIRTERFDAVGHRRGSSGAHRGRRRARRWPTMLLIVPTSSPGLTIEEPLDLASLPDRERARCTASTVVALAALASGRPGIPIAQHQSWRNRRPRNLMPRDWPCRRCNRRLLAEARIARTCCRWPSDSRQTATRSERNCNDRPLKAPATTRPWRFGAKANALALRNASGPLSEQGSGFRTPARRPSGQGLGKPLFFLVWSCPRSQAAEATLCELNAFG